MAKKIGIRELKNNASKIVRSVREEQAEYVVTVHGEPVAMLQPISEEPPRKYSQADIDHFIAEIEDLAEQVSTAWKSPLTAVEAVQEQRRDL